MKFILKEGTTSILKQKRVPQREELWAKSTETVLDKNKARSKIVTKLFSNRKALLVQI